MKAIRATAMKSSTLPIPAEKERIKAIKMHPTSQSQSQSQAQREEVKDSSKQTGFFENVNIGSLALGIGLKQLHSKLEELQEEIKEGVLNKRLDALEKEVQELRQELGKQKHKNANEIPF